MTERSRVPRRGFWLSLGFALAGLLLAAAAPSSALNAFDRELMEVVQNNKSDDLDHLMKSLSEEFNKTNFLLAAAPVAVFGDEHSFRAAEECLKAMTVAEAFVGPLKYLTNRKRPSGTHSRANSSFPSSHAASSFAAASSIGHAWPRLKIPAYAAASLVAYSRVYNQRHYPTDVMAGACIGVLAAKISRAHLGWMHVDRGKQIGKIPIRVAVDSDSRGLLRLYLTSKF